MTQEAAPNQQTTAAAEVTDHEMAAMMADTVEGSHLGHEPTPLGNAVYELIIRAIEHERNRCASLCQVVRDQARNAAELAAQAVRLYHDAGDGDSPRCRDATAMHDKSNMLAVSFDAIARTIMLPPGTCKACRGTKRMRSNALVSSTGAAALVECTACKPPAAPEAAGDGRAPEGATPA
jgi:hypothetical protein